MLFWQPTGRLGRFRGDSSAHSGSEIYSSVPVRIRNGHTIAAHLPPPLNRAPGAPPPPPLFPLWNGSRVLNFSGRRSSFLRWSRCICCPLFSQEAPCPDQGASTEPLALTPEHVKILFLTKFCSCLRPSTAAIPWVARTATECGVAYRCTYTHTHTHIHIHTRMHTLLR